MAKKILTYISLFLLCTVSMVSCTDHLTNGTSNTNELREVKGTLTLNLSTPDASVRMRSVNTDAGASIQINNLWVGVFSTTNGACIGSKKYDELNQVLQSGIVFRKLLTVDFVASSENLPLAYIVAVANYDGVTTWDGRSLDTILPDYDNHTSITWDQIINLDIDTESAYAGNKGKNENANAPFLAGFFQDAASLSQNPKIDQFSYANLGPTAIYPSAAADGMDIELGDESDNNIYVAAGAICLRRLVSHNVIRLNMSNGYEVTDVKYKRFNMPRTVYMLQRRTDTSQHSSFEEWQQNSPNRADHLITEGQYDYADAAFPYANDEDWISLEVNAWDDNVEFDFDHFENKHWGFGNLQSQDDREALNPDGTFAALCSGSQDAYNNFASYFVLKMHIINKSTGESADVEYTLHEGFCNTDDGRRASTMEEKCHDFSSFRNVNYNYNINIAGISDITVNVTGQDGQETVHPNGQAGSIWKMNYATGISKTPIPIEGGTFDYNGKYISFSNNPALGFRIYGRDDNGNIVDVCYNMPDGMYKGFSGLWPSGQPTYINNISSANALIPKKLLDGMQIGNDAKGYYGIVEFIQGVENGTITSTDQFTAKFEYYDGTGLTGNYMRGLYVFDRNDTHNATDADGCSSYHQVYGAEQYPFEFETIFFDKNKIAWDNTYYKTTTTLAKTFSTAAQIFYGAECSAIDLRWEHDERIIGYRISVFNDTYTHPIITVTPSKLSQYLHTIKGKTYFIYPLSTAAFPRSTTTGAKNYSFSVTPIVDTDMYNAGEPTIVQHNANGDDATCIRVCPTLWDINKTNDWKTLDIAIDATFEVHYRGLSAYCWTGSVSSTNYKRKTNEFITFGGAGNTTNKYFSFWASVPGKIAVACKSHSNSADANRQLIVARMSEEGTMTNSNGETYDEIYKSGAMAGTKTTYTTPVLPLYNGQPTEFRIYAAGSIDYYSIEFIPSN